MEIETIQMFNELYNCTIKELKHFLKVLKHEKTKEAREAERLIKYVIGWKKFKRDIKTDPNFSDGRI